jgi:aspartokinase/homoserine dehydrogenase 1
MIRKQFKKLSDEHNIEINVAGIANSKKMFFDENGITAADWKKILMEKGVPMRMKDYVGKMKEMNLPNSVFVDCTASEQIIAFYDTILRSSISVVTPNKKANSGSWEQYKRLRGAAQKTGVKFLYETNVGAGLPVINTLNDLLFSGDRVIKMEAVLSGTMNYLFSSYDDGMKFSDIVKEAKKKGYTEPDPRDDLSGMDVARKILILARETGLELELKDIQVENLVPESCKKAASADDFFAALEKEDHQFEKRLSDAKKKGEKLRYMASLVDGKAKVSLQGVGPQHPFYVLKGSDNIISFTTERYREQPLVVKGPGAGGDVTAAGVFADIIRISNYLS